MIQRRVGKGGGFDGAVAAGGEELLVEAVGKEVGIQGVRFYAWRQSTERRGG